MGGPRAAHRTGAARREDAHAAPAQDGRSHRPAPLERREAACGARGPRPAAGGPKKGPSGRRNALEALGRPRGGYGTKACVVADASGHAVAFALLPGQAHELPHAVPLLGNLPEAPKWVVADRGYSSHAFGPGPRQRGERAR